MASELQDTQQPCVVMGSKSSVGNLGLTMVGALGSLVKCKCSLPVKVKSIAMILLKLSHQAAVLESHRTKT